MDDEISGLTEVQHLSMQASGYSDEYRLGQADADYLLPLSADEIGTLQMALAFHQERAAKEDDEEGLEQALDLYNRVKYDGLVKTL